MDGFGGVSTGTATCVVLRVDDDVRMSPPLVLPFPDTKVKILPRMLVDDNPATTEALPPLAADDSPAVMLNAPSTEILPPKPDADDPVTMLLAAMMLWESRLRDFMWLVFKVATLLLLGSEFPSSKVTILL
jgi:hypothetical protein